MSDFGDQIDAFTFHDPDTGEECWVGVRESGGRRLLAISRQGDGDVEVSLDPAEVARLARALTRQTGPAAGQ